MKDKSALHDIVINLINHCSRWMKVDENGDLLVIDPIENVEISGHYGHTHLAASLLIYGSITNNQIISNQGEKLLSSILNRWGLITKISDFHADFNNFALCLAYEYCPKEQLREQIRDRILVTRDSKHSTINWLPMRAFVNTSRYHWTNSEKYLKTTIKILKKIQKATNLDGGIEDLLPKGTSYNLQYNISTLAGLFLLKKKKGIALELEKQFEFLKSKTLPDGDINYQGRGTNQIFGWGPWIYLLFNTNNSNHISLKFFSKRFHQTLENNNILLNTFEGGEKTFWWDYHYTSVYQPHLLLWCCLTLLDNNYEQAIINPQSNSQKGETGLNIVQNNSAKIVSFNGRSKYIAESGPLINAIWVKNYGILFKCSMGPYNKPFGEKYNLDIIRYLQFGLIGCKPEKFIFFRKHLRGLINKPQRKIQTTFFAYDYKVELTDEILIIRFFNPKKDLVFFNLPIFSELEDIPEFVLSNSQGILHFQKTMKIKSQYGWLDVYQSRRTNSKEISLEMKL